MRVFGAVEGCLGANASRGHVIVSVITGCVQTCVRTSDNHLAFITEVLPANAKTTTHAALHQKLYVLYYGCESVSVCLCILDDECVLPRYACLAEALYNRFCLLLSLFGMLTWWIFAVAEYVACSAWRLHRSMGVVGDEWEYCSCDIDITVPHFV